MSTKVVHEWITKGCKSYFLSCIHQNRRSEETEIQRECGSERSRPLKRHDGGKNNNRTASESSCAGQRAVLLRRRPRTHKTWHCAAHLLQTIINLNHWRDLPLKLKVVPFNFTDSVLLTARCKILNIWLAKPKRDDLPNDHVLWSLGKYIASATQIGM